MEAAEQRIESRADHMFQQGEPELAIIAPGEFDQAVEHRGNLDDRVKLTDLMVAAGRLDAKNQVEAFVVDMRDRVGRVDRQRGQDRKHLGMKIAVEKAGFLEGQIGGIGQDQPVIFQQRADFRAPHVVLAIDEIVGEPRHLDQSGLWSQAVGRRVLGFEFAVDLILQAGDAHLEKFVEVGCRDGQEPQTLQRFHRLVACFLQHALVEPQPAEFAIDVQVGVAGGVTGELGRGQARAVAGGVQNHRGRLLTGRVAIVEGATGPVVVVSGGG